MKIRQLIDMAIGSPESGHVNFSALHYVLIYIAERLEFTDELVDYHNNETERVHYNRKVSNVSKTRLTGGSNPEENNGNITPPEPEDSTIDEFQNAVVTIEDYVSNDSMEPAKETVTELLVESKSEISPKENDVKYLNRNSADKVISSHTSLSQLSVQKLMERITNIELMVQNISILKAYSSGISVMKDQLEFVMEQVLFLTFVTLSKKPNSKQIQQLYAMAQTLLKIKKDNVFIEGIKHIDLPTVSPLNWHSSGLQLNEDLSENDILEIQSNASAHGATEYITSHQDELDDHLCYSPGKLLDQLMELKSDFGQITNKVNELSASLLQQNGQQTSSHIHEIQEQIRDVKLSAVNLRENQCRIESNLTRNQSNIEDIKRSLEEILEKKVDKTNFEIQLANKVDYDQLQRKVSLDQLLELQCRIDRKLSETMRRINDIETNFAETVDTLKNTLGLPAIDDVLKVFKENITKDVQALDNLLKNYIEMTNDDSAAAGSRVKVLQNLACLSCDSNCVVRPIEKAKVSKLPNAHASNMLSPLITYELGSIRKSGIMGYYRKDEFPHATNAWMAYQSNDLVGLKKSLPQRAGGQRTTSSGKERIQKKKLKIRVV